MVDWHAWHCPLVVLRKVYKAPETYVQEHPVPTKEYEGLMQVVQTKVVSAQAVQFVGQGVQTFPTNPYDEVHDVH